MLEEQLGQLENAINGYTTFLELTGGNNKEVAHHLMQLALKQKISGTNKRHVLVDKSCFEKTLTLFEQKKYKQALHHIDNCLIQKPHDKKTKLLKIQILNAMQQFNHSAALLQSWINEDPNNQVWFQTLHLLARNGAQLNTITKTLQAIQKSHPKNIWAALYLADIYLRTKSSVDAISTLNDALKHTQDTQLRTHILFQLSILYFEQKKHSSMCITLEQCIDLTPTFAPALNLSAHYWATTGNNLEKADNFIARACKNNENNPHFLDTKALILYKKKEYNNALSILRKIHKQQPEDATIMLHLAKTQHKLGNTNIARRTLQKAETIAHSNYEKEKISKLQKQLVIR